ncbi:MAG: hypothetical protein QM669_09835 [Siphonobacter sp.]
MAISVRYASFYLFFILLSTNCLGQAKIIGSLKDNLQQPLVFANLTLHQTKDSSLVKGILSDSLGNFKFENIKIGNYIIGASTLSTKKKYLYAVEVADSSKIYDLGTIYIEENATKLSEVKVTAKNL